VAERAASQRWSILCCNPIPGAASGRAKPLPGQPANFGYGTCKTYWRVDAWKWLPGDPRRVVLTGELRGFMPCSRDPDCSVSAAVAGAGISDWQSYYGENSIDQWMTPYFGPRSTTTRSLCKKLGHQLHQAGRTPRWWWGTGRECPRRSPTSSGTRCGPACAHAAGGHPNEGHGFRTRHRGRHGKGWSVCPLHAAESLGLLPLSHFKSLFKKTKRMGPAGAKQRSAGTPRPDTLFLEFQERVSFNWLEGRACFGSRSFERF